LNELKKSILLIIRNGWNNQVVWAPVARSSFQGRTRGIPCSISTFNGSKTDAKAKKNRWNNI